MAFIAQEDEEQEVQPQGQALGGTIIGAGGPAPVPGQAPSPSGGSGQFTNIRQYIEANRPKAQEISGQIAGGFEKEAGALRSDIAEQRETTFQPLEAEQQRLAGGEQFIQEQIQQAGQQPIGESEAERFQRLRGPQAAQQAAPELTQQRASAADLERRAQALGTSAGRGEELSRLLGGRTADYGAGQRSLDRLLIAGARPSRIESLRRAREATRGLGAQVEQVGAEAGELAAQQATERQRLQELARTGVSGAREQLRADIEGRVETAQTGGEAALQQFREQQAAGAGVDPEVLRQLGIEGGVEELYGVDPTQILRAQTATRAGVTSPEELARLNALAGLAGQQGNIFGLTQEQIAGAAGEGGFGVEDLQSAITEARGQYETDIGAARELSPQQQADLERFKAMMPGINIPGQLGSEQEAQQALDTWKQFHQGRAELPFWMESDLATGANPEYYRLLQNYLQGTRDVQSQYDIGQGIATPEQLQEQQALRNIATGGSKFIPTAPQQPGFGKK